MDVVELSRLQFALTALYHFLFVPLTLGLSFLLVIMESVYVMTGRPIWRTITRFWATDLRHQLRAWRRHRPDHGVRVRNQLVLLLPLRRRHLRRAAGDRGPDGLLPGSHLRRPDVLRLGEAVQAGPPVRDLHGRAGLQPLGPMDPDRQRLDAEPSRRGLQSRHHAHGGDQLPRGAVQPGRPGQVRPHRQRRLRDWRRCSCSASRRSCC